MIKHRKAAGLDKIHSEVWKTRKFDDILFCQCNIVYKQYTTERRTKGWILLFSKKGGHGIAKNYRDIPLTAVATEVYNDLLNRIRSEIKKILGKNQHDFRGNHSITS